MEFNLSEKIVDIQEGYSILNIDSVREFIKLLKEGMDKVAYGSSMDEYFLEIIDKLAGEKLNG